MLKGSRRGFSGRCLQLFDQLPSVQGVQQVDVAGTAVQDCDGQSAAVFHVNTGRLLIGVTAIFQGKFCDCNVLCTHLNSFLLLTF